MILFDFIGLIKSGLTFIFTFFDKYIYQLDASIYDLMLDIASQKVFSNSLILTMKERVYQLLGLIMIFKLTFSFITYLLNPEQMLDKTKGFTNLIKKIIITLILIICVPWAFNVSRKLQEVIIDDHVIEYFIFGTDFSNEASPGQEYMYTVAKMMIRPRLCYTSGNTTKCSVSHDTTKTEAFGNVPFCGRDWPNEIAESDSDLQREAKESDIKSINAETATKCGLGDYDDGTNRDYTETLIKIRNNSRPVNGKYPLDKMFELGNYYGKGYYNSLADYKFLISTAIGLFIGYTLILMCMDVAVRSVKLGFYELISPIPIVSYIGFKDGKDTMFTKWYTQVLKTYADLFIRVIALQFANFFVGELLKGNTLDNSDKSFFVWLFLIIGALTFAKKFPDILKGMGIDFNGGQMFSLKKRLDDAPLAGKTLRTAVGAGVGTIGGIAGNWRASRSAGRNAVLSAGSAIGGAFSGLSRGAVAGAKAKKGFGINDGFSASGRGGQKIMARQGTTFAGRNAAKLQTALGVDTAADRIESKAKVNDEYADFKKSLQSQADNFAGDMSSIDTGASGLNLDNFTAYNTAKADFDSKQVKYTSAQSALSSAQSRLEYAKSKGNKGMVIAYQKSYDDALAKFNIAQSELSSSQGKLEAAERQQTIRDTAIKHLSGGVKEVREFKEDLENSTATEEEKEIVRKIYEAAQQYTIGHAHEFTKDAKGGAVATTIQTIKATAASYAAKNQKDLDEKTSHDAHASWAELKAGFNAAQGQSAQLKATEEYRTAQANKKYAQSKNGKK